jgi:hypothetical protein
MRSRTPDGRHQPRTASDLAQRQVITVAGAEDCDARAFVQVGIEECQGA